MYLDGSASWKPAIRPCNACAFIQLLKSCWWESLGPQSQISRLLLPTAPWQDICLNLLGPLPMVECILVVVDYFSRFMLVAVFRSTTSAKIIEAIQPMFAQFGAPYFLRTDNRP